MLKEKLCDNTNTRERDTSNLQEQSETNESGITNAIPKFISLQ